MEEEERKQKLKAGKEKLAKFQKKKKKKPGGSESDEQLSDVKLCAADDGGLSVDLSIGASPVPFDSELQLLSSFSEDDVSGTEEEPDSRTVMLVKSQLRDKTERVAELEENLVGKQLALDKIIEENQKLQKTIAEINKQGVQDNNDNVIPSVPVSQSVSEVSASMVAGSQSAEMSEDQSEILDVNQSAGTQSESSKQTFSIADVQELIQHVQWLQLQLKQAGTTLQVQAEKQVTTTQALQQAKSDILSLQDNIVTKDAIVSQLAEKLTTITTEYGKLKASVSTTKNVNVSDEQFGAIDSEANSSDMNENIESGYIEQINRLTEELEKLKERGSLEKQDLVKALTFLKESNENALKENEQLKLKNEEINDTLKAVSIEKTLTDDGLKSATLKVDDLLKEIEKLKHEQVIADQEKLVVSEEIEMLKLSNSSMSQEIQDLTSEIQHTNEGMKQLSVELNEMRGLKENLEEKLEDSRYQIESITIKNGSILNDNESLGAELESLRSRCQLHENQISEYQLQIEEYENKISEASDAVEENHSLRTQNDELYNKINNQKDVIASLKAETENVICKNMQLIEQLQDLSSSEALFKHDTDVLQQDKVSLQEELKGLNAILSTTQEENKKYKDTLAALELEIDALKQELQFSYSECERYKISLSEIRSKDQYDSEVKEQFFVKDSANRSESVNSKLSKTPNGSQEDEQFALSTCVSADETFMTATDLSRLEASIIVHENKNENIESSADLYTLDQTDSHQSIVDLQNENEALKKELFRLQAGSVVRSAKEFAEASLQLENENSLQVENEISHTSDARQQNKKQSQCFGESALPSDGTVSDIGLDDTAYNTYFSDEPEQSNTVTQEIVILRERMRTLQQEHNNVQRLLLMKEEECEVLNTELEHFKIKTSSMDKPVFLAKNLDTVEPVHNLSTTEGNAAVYLDATEVSEPHRIGASGMEVNLHASSALQTAPGLGSVLYTLEGNIDDHVFQNADAADQKFDCLSRTESPKDTENQERRVADLLKEKSELMAILEKERKKLSFASTERDKYEDLSKKYLKDLENQAVVMENMKDTIKDLQNTISLLETEVQNSHHENEKLEWHRDELELKMCNMEKEISDMKLEKCSVTMKAEQVREELSRVKERLEYLESSEVDIFEMKDVIDSIQLEKEGILKDNEMLKMLVSSKECESQKHMESSELLCLENSQLLENVKLSNQEKSNLKSDIEKMTVDFDSLKLKAEDLEQQICHLNGEMEGLVEENSTLKTKLQSVEAESQNLIFENEKLQSYFPNIDFQEEQLLTLNEKCRGLESHLQEVTINNETMVIEITDLEKKLLCVSDENELLLDKCDELGSIIAELDNEKTDLLDETETIRIRLNQVAEENGALLQKKDHEIEAFVEENSTLKTEVNNLKEDLKEVREQNKIKQVVEVLEKTNIQLESENSEYQKKISALEQDLIELVEQVQLYDDTVSEKEDLATRLEQEINSLLEENSTLKTKNNSLEHDLYEVTAAQNKLKENLKLYETERSSVQPTQDTNKNLLAKLELESKYKAKLQKDIEMLQIENELNVSKVKCVEEEKEKMGKELCLCENEKIESEKYVNILETEKNNLLKANKDLKDCVVGLEAKQCEILKQTESLTSELETCQLHLQAVSENRNHVRSQIEILAAEVETLSISRDHTVSSYCSLEKGYSELKHKKEDTESCLFTLENAHRLVKEENERYRILLENVHEKIEKLDNIISKNDELVSKNDYLCNKVDDMEVQVEKVKKEKAELEKMIGELTNMLHDMQTKYEEVKSEMESTKKKCDKEIKQLQMQLQTMNDDVQELRNMLDIMENEMYDATEEKLILKENLQEQQNQYEEAVERKQKLEEMLSEKHQKDVKNKITVCELMTNRASDAENTNQLTDTENLEKICEFCQNGYVRSSVSTFTQTEFSIEQTSLEHLLSSNHTDICDISSSQIEASVNALQGSFFSVKDFDKDEDTKGDACEFDTDTITGIKTYKVNSDLLQSANTSDFQCQVDIQDEYFSGRLVISEVQTNCFIPSNEYFQSQNFEGQSVEQDANEPLSGSAVSLHEINLTDSSLNSGPKYKATSEASETVCEAQELTSSIQQAAAYNLPAINIASEMVKNEKKTSFDECNKENDKGHKVLWDQICNETVKETTFPKAELSNVDMGNQNDSEFKSYECENDASNDLSLNVDLSVLSVDSGVFSAVRGMEFDFSSPSSLPGQLKSKEQNTMSKFSRSLYCCASAQTENSDKADYVDITCQTDSIEPEGTESLRKELEAEFEAKRIEMENEIEQRLNKKLDFREQKVKMQEKNYDLKVKQVEYELEEKFEQKFRMREAEIEVQAEFDRKDYEKEINENADRKIEKIKIEKDKQFVETMQKVRSDVKKKHKAEIAKLKAELQDVSGIGPSGDGITDGSTQENIIHKLSEENKDLATARDALLRRADSSSLQLQALRLDLQDIMGDEKVAEAPQLASQLLPSWLDWEIAPELSFGSIHSSIDEKSLSGSLDPTTYCANSNCLSMRTKYEQLVERIKKFLIIRQTDSSMSDTSTPRADVSDSERFETGHENHGLDLCRESDRFVENTDPEIPMLQRITSIHLEHSVRVPCSESDKMADKSGDQFVIEDVTSVPEINDGILEQIVNESKGMEEGEKSDVKNQKLKNKTVQSKGQIEGHFSENESEGEMENFSDSSVTIDYDQFDSYESESGTGVTDKDVHPFNECKFAKSVIRRHMSENELSDDEESSFRKRCFSDSETPNDRDSQKFVKVIKEREGLFVQELKANSDEASTGLRQASEFETVFDDHFEDSERFSKTEIVPSERVEQFSSVKKEQLSVEQDKFIAEIQVPPVEENPPGSEISILDDISDNDKTTGEDHGDFFEEVIPVVKRKRGQTLLDLNFKFESYSLDKDEFKQEIIEAEIVPSKVPETCSSFVDDVNKYNQHLAEQSLQHQRRNRLSLSEELKLAFPLESQNVFLDEHDKHDSGDILENLESDVRDLSLPVSKERQSYENTIFDVLNSICPGTNPVRLETNEVLNPAIQSCEHATQEFSISRTDELLSQIQCLRSELNNLKDRNESLNEKCRENDNSKQLLTELKKENEQLHCRSTENLEELEKVQFLKESLSLQLEKLKTENKSLHQLQLQSQDQIKILKTENDKYNIELRRVEKPQIEEENLIENNAKLVEENQCLLQSVSDLKKMLESQEHELDNMKGERDKAVSGKNDLQSNLELIKKESESKISAVTAEKEKLQEQIMSLVNQYSMIENDKKILQDSVNSLEEINEKNKTEKEELNRQLVTFEQNNDSLMKELEDLRILSKVEKDQLNEKIKTLEKENAELHEKTHKLCWQIDKVNVDTEELIKQLECKVSENKCYRGEVEKLKSAIQELNELIENSNEANASLCAENRNLHEEVLMLKQSSESFKTNKALTAQKLNAYQEKSIGQQCELDRLSTLLISKDKEIEVLKENIASHIDKELIFEQKEKPDDELSRIEKPLCYDVSDKYTETEEVLEFVQTVKGGIAATSGNDVEIKKLKSALDKSKEINEENEWAINELASQVEHLEMEKKDLSSNVESVLNRIEKLQESSRKELDKVISERNLETQKVKVLTEKLESLSNGTELDYENEQSVAEAALTKISSENALLETQLKIKCESADHVSKELSQRVKSLEKENSDLNVLMTYNRETFEKEKMELMEMYSDLKTEVDTLIETKKYLEDELSVLKELLESGDMKEPDISRELTVEDLEDMEELKSSIEHLKRDMKEKDSYVRKLEEHLLNLDGGLPDFLSAPKPTLSSGEPIISKAFSHKRFSFHDFGRQSHSLDRHDYVPVDQTHEQGKHFFGLNAIKTDPVDLDSSTVSESRFVAELDNDNANPLRSSVQSETESVPLIRDSFETSGKIKSGLKAEEDGHYALELKQFELVDEISKLRQDFRETKAVYEQETALLTEALEREKVKTENLKTYKNHLSGDASVLNAEKTVTVDLIRARQDIALLRRENNILRIENERWLNRIKEQEQIVLDLRERLTRNTSGIEEIEQVFGKQLALLQKQREELLDRIRAQEQENSTLSITLGEKSIIEDSLRREKEILTAKLQEKTDLEKELFDKQIALEKQKLLQKQLEEVVYQKDLNEMNLMKQKRVLEEELLEIESKFRDREENLGFEKNQLLDELREKHKQAKSEISESQDDTHSVCSDSSVSDQQIGRLELMLEEVEKQHKRAVKVLRDQLQSKYDRREKALRGDHAGALKDLHMEQQKQVK